MEYDRLMRRLLLLVLCAAPAAPQAKDRVVLTKEDGAIRVEIDKKPFTTYRFKDTSRPALYPVFGPEGTPMTRGWPFATENADEKRDHPHHRSLWFAHGSVNGHDFWGEGKRSGRIVHTKLVALRSGPDSGQFKATCRWETAKGQPVCTDQRILEFAGDASHRRIDFEITVVASHGDLVFGDTKEGTMAIRTHPALRLRGKVARGKARNSEGVTGKKVWGKRARWVHYAGPIGGRDVGIAIFDHPRNPSHPTWWHARDYGLVAANPFGVHDFERKPRGTGDLRVAKGQKVTFRYRFLFHAGPLDGSQVDAQYARYVGR